MPEKWTYLTIIFVCDPTIKEDSKKLKTLKVKAVVLKKS
jgi:hypothetical protein